MRQLLPMPPVLPLAVLHVLSLLPPQLLLPVLLALRRLLLPVATRPLWLSWCCRRHRQHQPLAALPLRAVRSSADCRREPPGGSSGPGLPTTLPGQLSRKRGHYMQSRRPSRRLRQRPTRLGVLLQCRRLPCCQRCLRERPSWQRRHSLRAPSWRSCGGSASTWRSCGRAARLTYDDSRCRAPRPVVIQRPLGAVETRTLKTMPVGQLQPWRSRRASCTSHCGRQPREAASTYRCRRRRCGKRPRSAPIFGGRPMNG